MNPHPHHHLFTKALQCGQTEFIDPISIINALVDTVVN